MDGRFLYIHIPGTSQNNDFGKTFMVALKAGHALPALPSEGITDERKLAASGTKVAEDVVFPGPNASLYAFARRSVHRNLYRVPIP